MALCVARRHPQLRVVGIDSDREALALARRRAEAEALTNVAFVVEDATRLHLQVVGGGEAGELKPLLDETDLLIALHAPYGWIVPFCVGGALAGHVITFRALLRPGGFDARAVEGG